MFSQEWLLHVLKQYPNLCEVWGKIGCSDGLLMRFHSMCLTLRYLEGVLYNFALIKHYWKSSMDCEGARISSTKFNESYKTLNLSKVEQSLFSSVTKTFINTEWRLWLPSSSPSRTSASANFNCLPSLQSPAEFSSQLNWLYEVYLHCMNERLSGAKAQLDRSCCLRWPELPGDGDYLECDQKARDYPDSMFYCSVLLDGKVWM